MSGFHDSSQRSASPSSSKMLDVAYNRGRPHSSLGPGMPEFSKSGDSEPASYDSQELPDLGDPNSCWPAPRIRARGAGSVIKLSEFIFAEHICMRNTHTSVFGRIIWVSLGSHLISLPRCSITLSQFPP